ncbi:ATP synthase F1 subunit epsilon [Acidobacteriota bacterium]
MELEVVTSTADVYKAEIKELYIPAYLGKTGILENHLPYISLIDAGEIYYKDINDKNHYLYINDGFLEVQKNKIVLLSDSLEKGEDFDKSQIEDKLKEIDQIITSSKSLKAEISPDTLDKALQDQKEFKIKLEIVDKIGRN